MSQKTQLSVDDASAHVFKTAFRSGLLGLAISAPLFLLPFRQNKLFTNQIRVFLITAATISYAVNRAEKEHVACVTIPDYLKKRMEAQKLEPPKTILEKIHDNQFYIVGGTWVTAVAATTAQQFSQTGVPFTLKLAQIRVVAQGVTLLSVVAMALLNAIAKN